MSHQQRQFKVLAFTLFIGLVAGAIIVGSRPASAHSSVQSDATEFFEKRVRPILTANCTPCHNPQALTAQLDLSTAEGFARGGESGPLINSANLEESRLLKVIGYSETLKMPPKGRLRADEIAALSEWG